MKKLISLIASLSLMATMVTPAFAAEIANNAPVTETVFTEISAEEFEQDWVGEPLPAGQTAYLVEVTTTGLDLSSVRSGSTAAAKKKRDGVLLMMAEYELKFDSTENVAGVYGVDGITNFTTEEKKAFCSVVYDGAPSAYPQTTDTATAAVTAEDAYVTAFVVTTTGTVTGKVVSSYKISSFTANSQTGTQDYTDDLGNIAYTVNGETGTTVTLGSVTPPPPVQDIIVANKMTLPSGLSWDVTINNYAPAKTYTATFTATGEADKVHDLNFSAVAEATEGASFGFAALLKLKTEKTNVELAVTKN